jgi:tartrate-resistant acid phosphatase type 5
MAIGDWGGQDKKPYTTKAEVYIADYMGDVAKDIGSQFTIALGDNFYDDGVSDVYDKRFKETYEDVFTAQSLQSKWYPVCGNHDYHGNCSAQIAYTSYSKRWYFPDFYYTQVFTVPGTSVTLQILFLDTIILTGISDPYDPTIPLGGPLSLDDAEKEWDWIEETLSKSVANWIIVCGHYPVWSAGKHGPTQVS